MQDPLNILNVNFSVLSNCDEESKKLYKIQRETRGFDDTETWNLDLTILKFILPRLQRFRELNKNCPEEMTEEEWFKLLDDAIYAIDMVVNHAFDYSSYEKEIQALFTNIRYLWW